jgi:hypothetical protein
VIIEDDLRIPTLSRAWCGLFESRSGKLEIKTSSAADETLRKGFSADSRALIWFMSACEKHAVSGLRTRGERSRRRRASEQRDELAPFQLIELHSIPASQGWIVGYRIGEDQSGRSGTILQLVRRWARAADVPRLAA